MRMSGRRLAQKRLLLISGIIGPVAGSNQSFKNTLKGYLDRGWEVIHICFFSKRNPRYQLEEFLDSENYKFIGIPWSLEKFVKILSGFWGHNFKKEKIAKKCETNILRQDNSKGRFFAEINLSHVFFFFIYSLFETIRGFLVGIFFRPQVVYAYEVYSVIPAFIISKCLGVPVVKRFQGVYITNEDDLKSYRSLHLKIAYKLRSDLAIVTNDGTGGCKLLTKLGFPRNRIVFLLNGIDERLFSFKCNSFYKNDVLEKYLLPADSKILTIFNRAYPAKRIDRAVYLLKSVRDKGIDAFLVWAGAHGPLETQIIEYAKELNVGNFFKYLGPIPYEEVLKLLSVSDLNLILNDDANLGNQILEAAWLGIPTLAIDDGVNSKIIKTHNITYIKPDLFEMRGPDEAIRILKSSCKKTHLKPKAIYSWNKRMEIETLLIEKLINRKNRVNRK